MLCWQQIDTKKTTDTTEALSLVAPSASVSSLDERYPNGCLSHSSESASRRTRSPTRSMSALLRSPHRCRSSAAVADECFCRERNSELRTKYAGTVAAPDAPLLGKDILFSVCCFRSCLPLDKEHLWHKLLPRHSLPVYFLLALALVHSCYAATHHGRTLSAPLSLSLVLSRPPSLSTSLRSLPQGGMDMRVCVNELGSQPATPRNLRLWASSSKKWLPKRTEPFSCSQSRGCVSPAPPVESVRYTPPLSRRERASALAKARAFLREHRLPDNPSPTWCTCALSRPSSPSRRWPPRQPSLPQVRRKKSGGDTCLLLNHAHAV